MYVIICNIYIYVCVYIFIYVYVFIYIKTFLAADIDLSTCRGRASMISGCQKVIYLSMKWTQNVETVAVAGVQLRSISDTQTLFIIGFVYITTRKKSIRLQLEILATSVCSLRTAHYNLVRSDVVMKIYKLSTVVKVNRFQAWKTLLSRSSLF